MTAAYELAASLAPALAAASVPGLVPGRAQSPAAASGNNLLVLMPDPCHLHPEMLLRSLDAKLGHVPAIGAMAGEDGSLGATFQFCGEEVTSASVAGFRLSGAYRSTIRITQGCRPIGDPLVVTRAEGGVVLELDGRPALRVMAEQIPRALLDNPTKFLRNLGVALPPDPLDKELIAGEYFVRKILGFDTGRGAFEIGSRVVEGQMLVFAVREAESAREDLKQMLDGVDPKKTGAIHAFGLYFNCAARGHSLYRISGVDTACIGSVLPGTPIAGYFGNAEIAPLRGANRIFTFTGVLALFGESQAACVG